MSEYNLPQKFNNGDRVVVISMCESNGQSGTIERYVDCSHQSRYVMVRLDGGKGRTYNENSLELEEKYRNEVSNMSFTGNYKIAKIKFIEGYNYEREYGFALFDNGVQIGDYVLCDTSNGYNVGQVQDIVTQTEYGKNVTKEIICKVDFSAFERRKEIRKQKDELKKQLDKAVRENQDLILYQTIAQTNPEVAKLLADYEALLDE